MTRSARRRGVALIMALWLMALLAVVLTAMASVVAADLRRTRAVAMQAQLRQMLHAGAVAALTAEWPGEARPGEAGAASVELELPEALAARRGTLRLHLHPESTAEAATVVVEAWIDGHRAAQSLRLQRRGERWHATSAELVAP